MQILSVDCVDLDLGEKVLQRYVSAESDACLIAIF